ncbi:unnamed protein product [Rotaria sp. Silwood2]|nr:unnamed protein product [Rotaria sp. Silwood2]CAF2830679.1 unnamed protein product [Rotaria sp. Silwood2]CAF3024673.1 unnamed protein product [Rotaria sp. Silwood2]CAF3263391.1 unnamed protein product [Rotaria sp. Silwood2]CAF3946772.1 unnamed protein product [Rotaria sp. Silwood2]
MISEQLNNTWILRYIPASIRQRDTWSCSCDSEDPCWIPLGFYSYSSSYVQTDPVPHGNIAGFNLGCQFLDFAFSTLECFYSASCIQVLIDSRLLGYENVYLPVDLGNIKALDRNGRGNFEPFYPLSYMVQMAFIDQWMYTADYASYYASCQPDKCTYTIDQKLRPIALVNSVIGLIGGLTVLLRLLVPSLIKIIHQIYCLLHRRTLGNKLYSSIIQVS